MQHKQVWLATQWHLILLTILMKAQFGKILALLENKVRSPSISGNLVTQIAIKNQMKTCILLLLPLEPWSRINSLT